MKNHRIIFFIILFVWFLVNLMQATYTEILSDEAYYGLYGRYLDWGYFDHPPMVALLIKISSFFFQWQSRDTFYDSIIRAFHSSIYLENH